MNGSYDTVPLLASSRFYALCAPADERANPACADHNTKDRGVTHVWWPRRKQPCGRGDQSHENAVTNGLCHPTRDPGQRM